MSDNQLALALLASVMDAHPQTIVGALELTTPDDVRLLDAPTADVLGVALSLAKEGKAPAPILLNSEMMRLGMYDGHQGHLRKLRVIDATTTWCPGERLPEFAAAVLAEVLRARMIAAGEAIVERARSGAEEDAWQTLVREGAAVRSLWTRLCAVREEVGA